jgi:demethylmenaquinone methyltransferase/2-methoxy-6-polyprenyl-1,4-benzoquinol methylase
MSEQVREMFSSIATRYDVTNIVLSFGVDRWWRQVTVKTAGTGPGTRVLDCATGTGDLALAFRRTGAEVVGTDFCAPMLGPAREKARAAGLDVTFEVADAMALPYPTASFDVASISFGIRNVDDPVKCLRAYQYLPRTAAAFPAGARFVELMERSGAFRERSARAFTGGITWLYRGIVAG